MTKVGRNDPCPCGSGKKHKLCCGRVEAPAPVADDAHEGAIECALAWLRLHHRKAFERAVEDEIRGAVLECIDFGDEDGSFNAIEDYDDDEIDDAIDEALALLNADAVDQLHVNITEWMLASGEMRVKGIYQNVAALVLGPRGAAFTSGQRGWLERLSRQPLALFDVITVVPGESVTVRDSLDPEAAPCVVREPELSHVLGAGLRLGARPIEVGEAFEFSGALYAFAPDAGEQLLELLKAMRAEPSVHPEDDVFATGLAIIEFWIAQFIALGPE